MVKDYGYYKELLKLMKEKKDLPITRINLFGSRMSSKTFSTVEFIIYASLIAKVKTYAFRYMADDKQKLFEQFLIIIKSMELEDKVIVNKTRFKITFPNGSEIEIFGLHKQKNDDVKLTGLSGAIGFDYGIAFAEERYEINNKEWSAVLQAIRGFARFIEIHAANPWIFTNDYVTYCHNTMAFDLQLLKKNGQQFKIWDSEIYHYSNYTINNFLEPADVKKLLQAAKHDPHRVNTILHGYPGVPEGSVWKHCLDLMFREQDWKAPIKFIGGVDYGEKSDAATAYIIGFSPNYNHAHVSHEYYWANNKGEKEYKNTNILARDIVEMYMNFIEDNNIQQDIEVFVDSSATAFITALNNVKESYQHGDQLQFYECFKYKVDERTEQIRTIASFGMLTIGEDCPEARREYQEQVYSKKQSEYVDGDDHATDAIAYGLANKWKELLDNLTLLQEKELQEA